MYAFVVAMPSGRACSLVTRVVATGRADLQVVVQKCSGLTQGLTTVTVRVAVPTLPALSAAEYVTV